MSKALRSLLPWAVALLIASPLARAEIDPATEPSVIAVGKVWPAVVNIATERIVRRTYQDPYDQLFNQFFGGEMRPPRELRQKVQSLGSGFIIDPAGFIVTNQHVVERAADLKIQVTTSDGKTYSATYIAGDAAADLALIKIDGKNSFSCISLKDTSPNLLGQTVLALGNPLGYGLSVSRGILSALNRTVTLEETEFTNLIQTDAAINPGNSGGPLIDLSGKLIGISSVKMAYTPQGVPTQGLGFGIPAATVRAKVRQFMALAQHIPAKSSGAAGIGENRAMKYFGLQAQDLTRDLTQLLGYKPTTRGVLVADVEEGSPAAEAGLKRGLVLFKAGGHEISGTKQLEGYLQDIESGSEVEFQVGIVRRIGDQLYQQVQTVSLTAR